MNTEILINKLAWLISTERLNIIIHNNLLTELRVDGFKNDICIISIQESKTYYLPLLWIGFGANTIREFPTEFFEEREATLFINQYRTIESSCWCISIVALCMLFPSWSKDTVLKTAKEVSGKKQPEMCRIISDYAKIKGKPDYRLPLVKIAHEKIA